MLRLIAILCLLAPAALAQSSDALQLYRALRTNGLDRTRVYRVRDAQVDIEDIHLTLNDGVIALLEPVNGHTTGAFFAGDGEVLIVPPTQPERESLTLHTGQAVLEERFTTGFFRLSDAFTDRILAATRGPADDPQTFVEKWGPAARSLSEVDALHLLAVLTHASAGAGRHLFHARLAGSRLGTFDVYLDTAYHEQVFLGQPNESDGRLYYDIWAAFPMRSARGVRTATQTTEPPATELGGKDIVVRRYAIDARVEPPHQLEAAATLDADTLDSGARVLVFQLSRYLRLSSVSAGGAPVAFIQNEALEGGELARRGNDVIAVLLPQPLQAGQKLQLRFRYAGPVMTEAGGGLMYVGARGSWYPNQELGMADYDLHFTYPAPWTLLATGKRLSETETAGMKQAHWASERPIPMAGFDLGEYVSSAAKSGQTVVESFAGRGMENAFHVPPKVLGGDRRGPAMVVEPRPEPAAHAPLVAGDAARAIDFLSAHIAPFPYSSLALAQVPGQNSLGWPGLIFLSGFVYLSPEERRGLGLDPAYEITYNRLMLDHEVAHEWFGDAVMRRGYRDDWVMEAIANYFGLLMLEHDRRAGDTRVLLDHYRERLLSKSSTGRQIKDAGPVTLGTRLFSSRVPAAYESVLYGRGTWLLHMLRNILRPPDCGSDEAACRAAADELFYRALRQLYLSHLGAAVSNADLQKAFEDVLPRPSWYEGRRSLDWFFRGWVNGTAIPRLELASVRIEQRAGKPVATGTLLQRDAPNSLVTLVPIYARVLSRPQGAQQQEERLVYLGAVFADGPETALRFSVPAGSRALVLDPFHTVLRQP